MTFSVVRYFLVGLKYLKDGYQLLMPSASQGRLPVAKSRTAAPASTAGVNSMQVVPAGRPFRCKVPPPALAKCHLTCVTYQTELSACGYPAAPRRRPLVRPAQLNHQHTPARRNRPALPPQCFRFFRGGQIITPGAPIEHWKRNSSIWRVTSVEAQWRSEGLV